MEGTHTRINGPHKSDLGEEVKKKKKEDVLLGGKGREQIWEDLGPDDMTKHITQDSQRSNKNIKNIKSCIACNLPMSAPSTRTLCLKECGQLLKKIFFSLRSEMAHFDHGIAGLSAQMSHVTGHHRWQTLSTDPGLFISSPALWKVGASLPSPHTETEKPASESNSPDGSV